MKVARQLTNESKDTITAASNEFCVIAKKVGHEELAADIPEMLDPVSYTHLTLPTNREV